MKGKLAIAETLIEIGANIDLRGGLASDSALNSAASEGHVALVKLFLFHSAEFHTDKPESNPLISAVQSGSAEIVTLLLDSGIDPNVTYRSVTGKLKNALSYAQQLGRKEIADLLIAHGCKMPIEGVDIPVNEPSTPAPPPSVAESSNERIIEYMRQRFGPVDELSQQEIMPVHDTVRIAIHLIRPHGMHPFLTLFTTGMSSRPMQVPPDEDSFRYAELMMHLPMEWPHPTDPNSGEEATWPLASLRKAAYYPHLHDSWLGGQYTIISFDDPPQPLGPNTQQTCLLLVANDPQPLLEGGSESLRFYSVLPIFTEERDFALQHGITGLLSKFREHEVHFDVDIHRTSVV